MSESTAALLANKLTAEETSAEDTDITPEEEVSQEEVDEDTTEEETETEESDSEDELPENIKEILSKNRKAVREAEARAKAAEKKLAESTKTDESTPSEADEKFKKLYVNSTAKAALAEAGLSTGTDRMLKLLDLSSVEVDEDGSISGLSDQIADLKEEFADLFAPKPTRKATVKNDAAGRREAPAIPKTSAQKLLGM